MPLLPLATFSERMPRKTNAPFLTLKHAAERLGVHPATLRRWADNGDVMVMVTPGGHRRFPAGEIDRLAQEQGRGSSDQLATQFQTHALSHTRAELDQHQHAAWMSHMDEAERAERRQMGRRLMGLMMQYIANGKDENDAILSEAQGLIRTYITEAKAHGLSMGHALQAVMFFRDNMVESAVLLPEATRTRPETNQHLMRQINTFMNGMLLTVAACYEGA